MKIDRHWNVFYPKNIAEASVLADYDTVEDGLHDIQEHFSDTFYSNMNAETGLINQALQLQEATESGDCIKAVSVLLFAIIVVTQDVAGFIVVVSLSLLNAAGAKSPELVVAVTR